MLGYHSKIEVIHVFPEVSTKQRRQVMNDKRRKMKCSDWWEKGITVNTVDTRDT